MLWSVALAALGYLAFALWSGWREVLTATLAVGLSGIAIALALSLVNYSLRFLRWQLYLHVLQHPLPWRPSLGIYLAGFALTTTPGKAGEILRGVLLKPWGMPYARSLAAFVSERLSDLLAIVLLALLGLSLRTDMQPILLAGVLAVGLGFLALSNQALLERLRLAIGDTTRLARLLHHGFDILLQTRRCQAPATLLAATALSLVAWAAEAWALHLILGWIGIETSWRIAFFVYAIAMLAGALSFMPGGLGSTEAVMIALLLWQGAGEAEAVAATVLIRMTTLWFAVALGIVAALRHTTPSPSPH